MCLIIFKLQQHIFWSNTDMVFPINIPVISDFPDYFENWVLR